MVNKNIIAGQEHVEYKIQMIIELSKEQKHELVDLVLKFKKIFSDVLGGIKNFSHRLRLKEDADHFYKSYSIFLKYGEKVDLVIERFSKIGIINRSQSLYINPWVVLIKKVGTVRL